MKYTSVYMESIGYELPPVVVTSADIENRLQPVYESLHINYGQLEALTGISERRWWEKGHMLSDGAASAARKALSQSNVTAEDLEVLIYSGVCRENFEPATACAVASQLGIKGDANIYDLSNACLGVLNGIIDIANRIELKQIRAGMVVSCETSRGIIETTIGRMLQDMDMQTFNRSLATLTGGSGAVAVLITDGSFDNSGSHKLLGAANCAAPEHHQLCRWGMTMSPVALGQLMLSPDKLLNVVEQIMETDMLPSAMKEMMTSEKIPPLLANLIPSEKLPRAMMEFMSTDPVAVLTHGVKLGVRTWGVFLEKMGWVKEQVDKVVCHQVGAGHREAILKELGINISKDFSTYRYLGNIGTVSLPLTAAIADQRGFLKPGERVSFLGIGSGLNCMMLGWRW